MKLNSIKSIQGNRPYMEDRYTYASDEIYDFGVAFIADGHGGEYVSELLCHELLDTLLGFIEKLKVYYHKYSTMEIAIELKYHIEHVGNSMKHHPEGSTLTGVFITPDNVYVYNVGDSRTLFQTNGMPLFKLHDSFDENGSVQSLSITNQNTDLFVTQDHDDNHREEVIRVKNSGGYIQDNRLNGILAITRAFGDNNVGKGLISNPDIYVTSKENIYNGYIVMYSDGVYEMDRYNSSTYDLSSQNCYHIATEHGALELVNLATNSGSDDNITAMVVKIN